MEIVYTTKKAAMVRKQFFLPWAYLQLPDVWCPGRISQSSLIKSLILVGTTADPMPKGKIFQFKMLAIWSQLKDPTRLTLLLDCLLTTFIELVFKSWDVSQLLKNWCYTCLQDYGISPLIKYGFPIIMRLTYPQMASGCQTARDHGLFLHDRNYDSILPFPMMP